MNPGVSLTKSQGWLKVAMPGGQATIRERRPDASECAYCHKVGRTFYDYVDVDPEEYGASTAPAFCNRDHWLGYELQHRLRKLTSIEEPPASGAGTAQVIKHQATPQLKKAKPKKAPYLAAVS